MESSEGEISDFNDKLSEALADEMGAIRETSLSGETKLQKVWVYVDGGDIPVGVYNAEVDALGRYILPCSWPYDKADRLALPDEDGTGVGLVSRIIRKEERYEGQRKVAQVCYLIPEEENAEDQPE